MAILLATSLASSAARSDLAAIQFRSCQHGGPASQFKARQSVSRKQCLPAESSRCPRTGRCQHDPPQAPRAEVTGSQNGRRLVVSRPPEDERGVRRGVTRYTLYPVRRGARRGGAHLRPGQTTGRPPPVARRSRCESSPGVIVESGRSRSGPATGHRRRGAGLGPGGGTRGQPMDTGEVIVC